MGKGMRGWLGCRETGAVEEVLGYQRIVIPEIN